MSILRIGVGEIEPRQEGYLNVDIRDLPNIDVVADAVQLPFNDGEHDGIESRNLVEHFGRHEIQNLFNEWARVLKKGGSVVIQTIDMGELMLNWQEIPTENMLDGILGAQTYPENFHKMAFTIDIMKKHLKDAGFVVTEYRPFIQRLIPRMQVTAIKQ
jgi:predicted SAM-dependent methyltransferase